ncbi:Crp/Fnr family transcriptional regulator [Paenibacillus chondroitinus]|uniref:Crp/Fnr family transcriptional regulator n=1 Tax=Paenibacillus chondroitinus TaxID=59842 RepID=A0ABU6DJY8_9BACL|nr:MULTISPECIES: Crp/Fnr family transcriptional regulator [Paenibacillus]MCY9661888.1 Crp/Fnr family transcriptional regulator [Paenibacillus anseongense]MEB4798053.1 Crp/Fnr family transcriptional regulator [Paenibacillus chondroitinus]
MKLHKGETLFRQGESGGLYRLKSGLLKIVRVHEDGHATLVNIIVPEETIPHHSLISPKPYYGTAVALVASEIETIPSEDWYRELDHNPERFRIIAQQLQEKLRMMQQRIDQLTEVTPTVKLQKLEQWMHSYLGTTVLTDVLTQEEIGQLIGLRRETVNRLLREKVAKL